jgi:glutaredoxin/glutathione-dependent peroxiredoxin
MFKNSLLLFR